jgi:uncharacterized membrane protein
MKKIVLLMAIGSFVGITSCSKDKDETTTVPVTVVDPVVVIDPNAPATFATVKKIMDAKCTGCHSLSTTAIAGPPLTDYSNVKRAVEKKDRNLIDLISLEKGAKLFMPQNGEKLPQSNIDLIKRWKAEGYKE